MPSTTPTLSVVNAPPVLPPVVGLIPACQRLGVGVYLIDDEDENVDNIIQDGQGNLISGPTTLPQRWEGGFRWLPEQGCTPGSTRDPCADSTLVVPTISGYGSLNASPTFTGSSSWEESMPTIVETGDTCSAFGFEALNYRDRAVRALLATESYQAAAEFWTGTIARAAGWSNQILQAGVDTASGAVHDVTPAGNVNGVTPGAALAALEQGIAVHSLGAPAAIHCTRQLGAALSELGNTFRAVNGLIYTYMGSVIIPDAGYPGSSATGTAATGTNTTGSQWAFATGLPTVRRSPIEVIPATFEEALDRTVNLITFRALRLISVSVPPCPLLQCQVNLPIPA